MFYNTRATYTRLKAKCLLCSVHFIVCTLQPERHSAATLFCPECGQHEGAFMLWSEDVVGGIAQEVPGNATPT
ncbi:hypothetical protein [Variovorax sp. WS11]|uniref:hypothetical protein n=1 Tax=Variovorax sp. WS11 TaxID=1105204 RepID=UPI0011B20ECD|nr:hypothetical protein [Variovorax sp. WS11]NDZ12028.1 hypothetical protein [Variovorax sp. WS11]